MFLRPLPTPPDPCRMPCGAPRPATIDIAIALAAWDSGVEQSDIDGGRRGEAQVAGARQLAIYLAHVALGHDLSRLSLAFGRDRATIRHALRRVEDDRDDPAYDRRVSRLEAILLLVRPVLAGEVRA
jgi:chromosomal replication initiation ATPase DnaA